MPDAVNPKVLKKPAFRGGFSFALKVVKIDVSMRGCMHKKLEKKTNKTEDYWAAIFTTHEIRLAPEQVDKRLKNKSKMDLTFSANYGIIRLVRQRQRKGKTCLESSKMCGTR